MAGEAGFEPTLADPESAVLPLDDSPVPVYPSFTQGCSGTSPWHSFICSGVHSSGFPLSFSGNLHSAWPLHIVAPLRLSPIYYIREGYLGQFLNPAPQLPQRGLNPLEASLPAQNGHGLKKGWRCGAASGGNSEKAKEFPSLEPKLGR